MTLRLLGSQYPVASSHHGVMRCVTTVNRISNGTFRDNYCVQQEEWRQPISFEYCYKMAATKRREELVPLLVVDMWRCGQMMQRDWLRDEEAALNTWIKAESI